MEPVLPINLRGENLGLRHQYYNLRLKQIVSDHVSFEDIEVLPEQTALDRLFKIDLANKLKNVEYILNTLKDDDMLYVSKALKCKWLLERRDIINPKYLEEKLFPHMVMPAISKMKHWLYINLCEPVNCQEFYLYYKCNNFNFAVKFLIFCEYDFILQEFPEILSKITPHYLKILGEKYPKLVKLYFDTLGTNSELVKQYLKDEKSFYNSIKYVLKKDPDVFLDIAEKYHSRDRFTKTATDYILRFHKNRFMAKPELYVVHLLHIPTVARLLSVEECKEIVLRLARAAYLSWWFSYTNVEPLIKRIEKKSRSAFKTRIFVDKDIGEIVVDCPYDFPASPVTKDTDFEESHVFLDREYEPISMNNDYEFRPCLRQARYMSEMDDCMEFCPRKSELQKLFDEFRFIGFEGTLHELKERLNATSSADRRRDMLLVLVSKTGGREESLRDLLQLALRHRNEPVHERAAVVRSLVKRASIWRLPEDVWDTLLDYGIGLGLDGTEAEADCYEGLHAVVLRQLLATGDCDSLVRTAFLDDFSTLSEYKLMVTERAIIANSLQKMLATAASVSNPEDSARYLSYLLDVLVDYHVNIEKSSAVSEIADLAKRDPNLARPLLKRLYTAGVGRRSLIREYLEFRYDDAALVNVLRHDLEVLDIDWFIKLLIDGKTRPYQFFLKLVLYFNESGGAAEKIRVALQNKITQDPDVKLARPLAMLTSGDNFQLKWCSNDKIGDKQYKLSAVLRANMHRSRPAPDALALGWRKVGLKAVAVRVMRCRPVDVTQIIQKLFEEGTKRTVRLALALAHRTNCVADIFSKAASIRASATLRAALLYFRSHGEAADLQVWHIVKPLLLNMKLKHREGLCYILRKVEWVPKVIKSNYCAVLYLALEKVSSKYALCVLRDLIKCIHEVSDDVLDEVLSNMLKIVSKESPDSCPAIVIRYLMLSKSMPELNKRFDVIGTPFLEKIYKFHDEEDKSRFRFFEANFIQISESLKYNFAFFDVKNQTCLTVMERVTQWMLTFLPKQIYFKWYVHIHATMLYFKAIRESIKQRPEIFEDGSRKMSEGVDIVGFAFGRYVVGEVAELTSKYFESVVELYANAFTEYLNEHYVYGKCKSMFTAAIIKGMLSENVGCETLLGVHILKENRYYYGEENRFEEIKELVMKKTDLKGKFFFNALIVG